MSGAARETGCEVDVKLPTATRQRALDGEGGERAKTRDNSCRDDN